MRGISESSLRAGNSTLQMRLVNYRYLIQEHLTIHLVSSIDSTSPCSERAVSSLPSVAGSRIGAQSKGSVLTLHSPFAQSGPPASAASYLNLGYSDVIPYMAEVTVRK